MWRVGEEQSVPGVLYGGQNQATGKWGKYHNDYKWRISRLSVGNQTIILLKTITLLKVIYYFQNNYLHSCVIFLTVDFGTTHPQVVGVSVNIGPSPAGSHHVCRHGRGKSEAVCGLCCRTESFGGETASTSDSCCSDHGIHCHHKRGKTEFYINYFYVIIILCERS